MSDAILGVRAAGDQAVLVELAGLDEVLSLQEHLTEHPFAGQLDVVAASLTVMITADSTVRAKDIAAQVGTLELDARPRAAGKLVTIDAVYDGEDLDLVAELTGLRRDEVIALHTGQIWTAAFVGFAPGFAYLVGADRRLNVPRRPSPRTSVPAGSIALAGNYSAIYPRQSPGGWQLIGRTAATIWDINRPHPALIGLGDRVRFQPVRELIVAAAPAATPAGVPSAATGPGGVRFADVVISEPGMEATIQDLGRTGFAYLGVTTSGALDRGALRRANRLVGNRDDEAAIEVLYGGFTLEAITDQVMSVTGAVVPLTITSTDGVRPAPLESPFALRVSETIELGRPTSGLRNYVAFRGGLDVRPVLGSRSTDTLSGIGPPAIVSGCRLSVGAPRSGSVVGNPESAPEPVTEFLVVPGPRDDWFSPEEVERFYSREWLVTAKSNRIGVKFDGAALVRDRPGELPSEGTVRGAIQIPPDGLPVLFLADHPVTGGYPVIGVVASAELDHAAQLVPGSRIRFRCQR